METGVSLSAVLSRELAPSITPPLHWQHLTVLVVEDHSAYRVLMGWFLEKLGLGHQLVGDGQHGLAALAERPFDLVISDCQMPLMDGYTMSRAIRLREQANAQRRVPIIALTGNLVHDDPQRCRDAGMDAWLLKPLTLEQLQGVLALWLPGPASAASNTLVSAPWPTRASLVETFGDAHVVDQMLTSLLCEAREDSAALERARLALDGPLTAERLHRLVGSLAFLGGAELELRGMSLIERVRAQGMLLNKSHLEAFQADLRAYLKYLGAL